MKSISKFARLSAVSLALSTLAITGAQAQGTKHVVVEPVAQAAAPNQADPGVVVVSPAFQVLNNWVTQIVVVEQAAPTITVTQIRLVPLQTLPSAAATPFEPAPVITGVPDLPLVGGAANGTWDAALNYQGLNAQLLVLNSKGNRRDARALSSSLRAGDRFKIRFTATFNGQASIDQVVGDAWTASRIGQAYPQAGQAIGVKAGQTIDLPVGPYEYFVMPKNPQERFVLTVRHGNAVATARSNQPAYRQDSKTSSSYLQLVPAGTFPAIEQVVAQPAAVQ